MLGYRTTAPADPGKVPSLPQHPRSRVSLPPPRSQLLFKGAFLGTLLRERAPGRKHWELLPSGCQQTRGTGSMFCNSSKIRGTSQPVRSCTQHPRGSWARLRDPGIISICRGLRFPGVGWYRCWGCLMLRNPAQWENPDRERVQHLTLTGTSTTPGTTAAPQPSPNTPGFHWENLSQPRRELNPSLAALGTCRWPGAPAPHQKCFCA